MKSLQKIWKAAGVLFAELLKIHTERKVEEQGMGEVLVLPEPVSSASDFSQSSSMSSLIHSTKIYSQEEEKILAGYTDRRRKAWAGFFASVRT